MTKPSQRTSTAKALVLALGVAVSSCGKSSTPSHHPSDSGDAGSFAHAGGADGAEIPNDSAGSGGDTSVDLVTLSELEPGTCGIVRSVQLLRESASIKAAVTRQAGGFTFGP